MKINEKYRNREQRPKSAQKACEGVWGRIDSPFSEAQEETRLLLKFQAFSMKFIFFINFALRYGSCAAGTKKVYTKVERKAALHK